MKIVLFTATGAENLGDELITLCEIQRFLLMDKNTQITLFSHDINRTKRFLLSQNLPLEQVTIQEYFPNGFRTHPIRNIWLFWQTLVSIKKANHVYIGGGGLLYSKNEEWKSPLFLWSLRARIARFFWKPLTYISLGVTATIDELRTYASALFLWAEITVRDQEGQSLLHELGYQSRVQRDPVFDFVPYEKTHTSQQKAIGLALRAGFLDDSVVSDIVRWLLQKNYDVLLLPHSLHPTDESAHDGYYLQQFLFPGVRIAQSIEQTLESYASCDVIIGMRLHSIILSLVYDIPLVAVSYGKKTQSILEQNGIEYLNPKTTTAPEVLALLDKKTQKIW